MRERIFHFGAKNGLIGILTEPTTALRKPDAPVVVASNVGLNHRVGPHRLYVELARHLASSGYSMLRFDLSGLGESEPRQEAINDLSRATLDVQEAMELLQQRAGATSFVQLGMCSGVDSVHRIAVADSRVVGAMFLEGYIFRTPGFYVRRYLKRPLSPRFWKVYVDRKLREHGARGARAVREVGEVEEIYSRVYPSRRELRRDYRALTRRGVNMLFVFAGGLSADQAYNYQEQFIDCFGSVGRDPRIEVEFYPGADHVYSVLAHRERLIGRLDTWLQAHFP